MARSELHETAKALVAPGKGFLAADESDGTIKKRFAPIGVESTEEHRRVYRELLFTTPGAEEYSSGVILFDETMRQSASDGTPFPELLASKGIIPGIKVDQGAKPLVLADRETITEGLDGLRGRLEEYRGLGARFAKWRATYSITDELPSELLRLGERSRLGTLCGAVPGGRNRPGRRARGASGWHAHDRAQLPRHLARARRALHRALRPAR
jgi:fructose-bisphosphate aldolase class I